MKFRYLFLLIVITKLATAQNHNSDYTYITKYDPPKSPNASAFEQYVTVPANYQTGQVNPSIPLMSFSLDGVNVPISLNYSSTGLKLTNVPTWVGQGWSLNVGGTITRSVKGLPDDIDGGLMNPVRSAQLDTYISNVNSGLYPQAQLDYLKSVSKQMIDSEHDIFYFDVLGSRGSFYINKNGKCVQMPNTNNNITFTKTSAGFLDTMKITNEGGDKFIFAAKEVTTTLGNSTNGVLNLYISSLQSDTWYLTKVITKNNQEINFTYNTYHYTKADKSQSQSFPIFGDSCFPGSNSDMATTIINATVNVLQLSKISWKNGYINFNPGSNRTDLQYFDPNASLPSLGSIEMYQNPVGTVESAAVKVQGVAFTYTQLNRLTLNQVNFYGNNTVTDHNYHFNYYAGTPVIPPVTNDLVNAQDYWAYYNGVTNNTGLIAYNVIGTGYGMIGVPSDSMSPNRAPSSASAMAGMLQEIYYPTGGKTKFYYEGNIVNKSLLTSNTPSSDRLISTLPQSTDGTLVTLGGIRVNKIEYYADPVSATPSTITNIIYDPMLFSAKSLPYYVTRLESDLINNPVGEACSTCSANMLYTLHSSSVIGNPSSVVEYGKVTEYSGATNGAGQTVHNYDYSQIVGSSWYAQPYATPQFLNYYARETKTSNQLPNGTALIEKGETFSNSYPSSTNNDLDLKVSLIHNDDCSSNFGKNLSRYPVDDTDATNMLQSMFSTAFITIFTENFVPTNNYQNTYAPNSQIIADQTNISYASTANPLLPTSTSKANSKDETLKTNYKYPQDYGIIGTTSDANNNGIFNLISHNLLNIPIEQLEVINKGGTDYVTGGTLSTFYPNQLAVSKVYKLALSQPIALSSFPVSTISGGALVFDSRYQLETQYLSFNAINQPLEFIEKRNGVSQSLIWGYRSTFPIAAVTNARVNEIYHNNFEETTGFAASTVVQDATHAHTGNYSGLMVNTSGNQQSYSTSTWLNITLSGAKKYKYGGWVYSTGPGANIYLLMKRAGETGNYSYADYITTSTAGGWVYLEKEITVPADVTQLNLRLDNNSNGSVWFDDLRLYPSDAQMTTYTYKPLTGMTSMTDPKGEVTTYEYDAMQRVSAVKNKNGNIVKAYCYNYAGQMVNCFVDQQTQPVVSVYAKLRVTSTSSSPVGGYTQNYATYEADLFSDAACTIAYTAPVNITVNYYVATATTYNNGDPESDSSTLNAVVVNAGNSSAAIGTFNVSGCSNSSGTNATATRANSAHTASTNAVAQPNGLPGEGASQCTTTALTIAPGTGYTPEN